MDISLLVRDVSPVYENAEDVQVLAPAEIPESPTTQDIPPFSSDVDFDEETDPTLTYENPTFFMNKATRQIWSKEERDQLNGLRAQGMKWKEIALSFPQRSPASVRSQWHYQNQTNKEWKEREKEQAEIERSKSEAVKKEIGSVATGEWDTHEWSEELKDDLAKTYNKLKAQMWNDIAIKMGEPWKAVEMWHWIMGPSEIAARAAAVALVKQEKTSSHRDCPDPLRLPRIVCSPLERDSSSMQAKPKDPKPHGQA